jgi:hypothetical protein
LQMHGLARHHSTSRWRVAISVTNTLFSCLLLDMAENVGLVAKLQVGDFVDVRDTLDVWRVGFVISATGTYVGIKYMGWSDLFIQGIARTSHRLAEVRLLRGGNMGCACCLPNFLCLSCPPPPPPPFLQLGKFTTDEYGPHGMLHCIPCRIEVQ